MPSSSLETVCADCNTSTPPILDIRRRFLCHDCFCRYVSQKVLKRMESNRVRNQVGDTRTKILLPLSGGVSSLSLLHILDQQLKRQIANRVPLAHDLLLVRVRSGESGEDIQGWEEAVRRNYPAFELLPSLELPDVLQWDDQIEGDLQHLGLLRDPHEDATAFITKVFVSARTASAKSDLKELLLQRLLIAVAKKHDCDSILWGHSNSCLAAKALADVAKGRGGSTPSGITDGMSPRGVKTNYPMRDLYKRELELYTDCQVEAVSGCLIESDMAAPVSIRDTSIDDLLTGYINSQGAKFPNIMANVVRTTGKLQALPISEEQRCKICSSQTHATQATNNLCYGCDRLKQDIKT